jgi:hypothetical protein
MVLRKKIGKMPPIAKTINAVLWPGERDAITAEKF